MTGEMVFCYVVIGSIIGVVSWAVSDELNEVPVGAAYGIGFLCGLLWPLATALALGYGILRASIAIGRSFAVPWRAVMPVRFVLPRAKVRR